MSLAIVYSRASSGIHAPLVTVEVHLSPGLPYLNIVGLPEAAVKESKERVRSALINSAFEFPTRRVTINLAPADLPKEGGRFDLPIALGVLAASHQMTQDKLMTYEFTGELALSGELRPVRGILPIVLSAKKANRSLIIPAANAEEASVVKGVTIYFAEHLLEVCGFLQNKNTLPTCDAKTAPSSAKYPFDLSDVRGQPHAKRALEIAAAGRHSLLLIGPPGTGKTMLATRFPSLLPMLSEDAALEVAALASISSAGFKPSKWQQLPFRAPHHTSSSVALVGGGRPPRPGEISLAHHGVLFLDELPEFSRHVLECLREPLESGTVTISRAAYQSIFPARFQLIAAMNPCPCGYAGSQKGNCRCTQEQVQRYMGKLSGPLLDRLDMQVEVPSVPLAMLSQTNTLVEENSLVIKERVEQAQSKQYARQSTLNSTLLPTDVAVHCQLDEASQDLLNKVMKQFNMSARVYHRVLKLARTIADLALSDTIQLEHVGEALSYRCLDRARLTTI